MKIAIISESPTVTTGFGVTCGYFVKLLAELQHEVVCFGVCALGQAFDPSDYPCRIEPMPRDQQDALTFLPAFLRDEQPDLVLINYDLGAVCRFIAAVREAEWRGPIITHFVIDGIPFDPERLDLLRTVAANITPTETAGRYARECGVESVLVAPHPVDRAVFRPLPEREALRRAAGLTDRFVVGVFGRNVERKQQPRVMLALQQLNQSGDGEGIVLYLHCQPRYEDPWLNSWNLDQVARQLGIADQVLFPQPDFRQLSGIPYQRRAAMPDAAQEIARPAMPADYSYVERLNCCDLIVNVPYAGAFELVLVEGQSCGVPVAVTNDRGTMAEVVGDGALLLEPVDVGIHSAGGYQHFVAASTIAAAIRDVRNNPELRPALVERGFANVARYTIDPLRQAVRQALEIATRP